jgi:hypothetical protein
MMVHLLRESSTRSLGRHGLNSHVKKEVTSTVDVHEKSGRMDSQILQHICRFCIFLFCLMMQNPFSSGEDNPKSLNCHEPRVAQQQHHVLTDSGGPSKPPLYVVLGGTCLTPAQDKIVQKKVKAMKLEVPIFVAAMSKNNVGCNDAFIMVNLYDPRMYINPEFELYALLLSCLSGSCTLWLI